MLQPVDQLLIRSLILEIIASAFFRSSWMFPILVCLILLFNSLISAMSFELVRLSIIIASVRMPLSESRPASCSEDSSVS